MDEIDACRSAECGPVSPVFGFCGYEGKMNNNEDESCTVAYIVKMHIRMTRLIPTCPYMKYAIRFHRFASFSLNVAMLCLKMLPVMPFLTHHCKHCIPNNKRVQGVLEQCS